MQLISEGFSGGSDSKESACQCRRTGFIRWEDSLEKEMTIHFNQNMKEEGYVSERCWTKDLSHKKYTVCESIDTKF